MSNYLNQNVLRIASHKGRQKSSLADIYKQKYRNLNGRRKKPSKLPKSKEREIFYTETEYNNIPKTSNALPKRHIDETFEEYYNRIRSGIV